MGILAVDDEEGELVHWAWGYDSENLSNVEEVAVAAYAGVVTELG